MENIKSGTIIKACKCKHKFQDECYGKNRRVYNLKSNGRSSTCTVCGNKKEW